MIVVYTEHKERTCPLREDIENAPWDLLFERAGRFGPDVHHAIRMLVVNEDEICTARMPEARRFFSREQRGLVGCSPCSFDDALRCFAFLATWARASRSHLLRPRCGKSGSFLSAASLADVMKEAPGQVAYSLGGFVADEAVQVRRMSGIPAFSCDVSFTI